MSCWLLAHLPQGAERGVCYTCSSACPLLWWDLLSALLSKSPPKMGDTCSELDMQAKHLGVWRQGERRKEDKGVSSQHGVKTCGYVVLGTVSSLC